jgi:hypothetical protein
LLLSQVLKTLQALFLLDDLGCSLLLNYLLELFWVVFVLISEEVLHRVIEEFELFLNNLKLDLVELFGLSDFRECVTEGFLVDIGFPELLRIVFSELLALGCEWAKWVAVGDKLEALVDRFGEGRLHLTHFLLNWLQLVPSLWIFLRECRQFSLETVFLIGSVFQLFPQVVETLL